MQKHERSACLCPEIQNGKRTRRPFCHFSMKISFKKHSRSPHVGHGTEANMGWSIADSDYALRNILCAALHNVSKGEAAVRWLGKILLFCSLFLAGCATNRESAKNPGRNAVEQSGEYGDEMSYWNETGFRGKPKIIINLDEQRAYFFRGNEVVRISVVSTGREGYRTPSGEFSVIEKDRTHVSSIYGDYVARGGKVLVENVDVTKTSPPRGAVFRGAPMPYFLRIHGGIGMHAGYLPGYPASHGCIRLPKEMAARLFQNTAIGTRVVIQQEAPRKYRLNPLIDESYAVMTVH